jgi:uncharacterized glyoxalase superfamily protein PhnB
MSVRLSVIEIVAEDMGRSLAFYRLLGLDIPEGCDGEPHVEAMLPGGMKVAWDSAELVRSLDPDYQPAVGHRMSLAFQTDSPAEVDKLYQQLLDAGHTGHQEPWDAFWGQRYAVIYDPDGNSVDLFATL